MRRITKLIVLAAFFSAPAMQVSADVYQYTADDGSVCFTDSPGNKNAVLIIRESRYSGRKPSKSKNLKSLLSAKPGTFSGSTRSTKHPGLPVNGIITSATGLRIDPFDGLIKNHKGIDLAIPTGTPVRPVSPGTVSYSGCRNGYGNMVIIDHGDGLVTLYAHNSRVLVSSGERVDQDTTIALSGSTGRSTGPHLHFEAWRFGENVTEEYLPDNWVHRSFAARSSLGGRSYPIRKVVMSDGSIVLTNLPKGHP